MDYNAEFKGPTELIGITLDGPTPDAAMLTSLDAERDLIVGHLANDFSVTTSRAIQNKNQVDIANTLRRRVKDVEGKKTSLQGMIASATSDLSSAKQNLNLQLSKQKIAFEMLSVFAITIVIYILFGSSSYVHIIALVVVGLGFLYILTYNAYHLGSIGEDVGSTTLSFLGSLFSSNDSSSYDSMPTASSLFSTANAAGP
jgi:hypothetical protein